MRVPNRTAGSAQIGINYATGYYQDSSNALVCAEFYKIDKQQYGVPPGSGSRRTLGIERAGCRGFADNKRRAGPCCFTKGPDY